MTSAPAPRLSVITICRNDRDALEATIASVRRQRDRDFEYIVVDGGSTDGSLELIRANADLIDRWVSEADSGIYNAMNKGVRMAAGEYCQFLNAGDTFASDTVTAEVLPELDGSADVCYGYVLRARRNGRLRRRSLSPQVDLHLLVQWTSGHIQHQGAFARRSLLMRHPFDESLRIAADYRFWLEAYLDGAVFRRIDTTVAVFDNNGISNTNPELSEAERRRVLGALLPPRAAEDFGRVPHRIAGLYRIPAGRRTGQLLRVLTAAVLKASKLCSKTK